MASQSDLGPLPRWDLSNVYPGLESGELAGSIARLKSLLDDLDGYLSVHHISRAGSRLSEPGERAKIVCGYLDRRNALLRLHGTLTAYVSGFTSTDSYNSTARRIRSELDGLGVRLERHEVLFRGWVGMIASEPGALPQILAQGGTAGEHAFYLDETARWSRYLMSEEEETLAAELSLSGAKAWQKLHGVVTSQLKAPFERDGRIEELPVSLVQSMKTDVDGEVRRRAYEAEMQAWQQVREPLAACLNGVKGAVVTLYKRRGRTDALHEALDRARMDREILETMLGAIQSSFPAFRRYWQGKANRLGKDRLPWWDLWAPVGRQSRRYTYAEARSFLLEQFSAFSGRLAALARRAFDQSWIDAEPRNGKRGGAFCMKVPAVEESRILCNFDGSLGQVLTLAHELGHAYHNECHKGKSPLQRITPMTLAETASIFNETIITDAALARAADPEEELAILEALLIGASQVLVDIYSRYLFEKEVFERRASAELSADDFCDIMIRAQRAAYGDSLDPHHLNPYMWTWKPHYYLPDLSFYNFPYAFGLLFGLGLYAVYRERGPEFLKDYDELLRSTGEATASELAARFNIDLHRSSFWEASLKVVERRIDRYLEL